jgi:hypothetical protein
MGKITIEKTVSITKQICKGLTEAHRLGVVHRDLKSRNIMIDREGNARIMDFGIARSLKAQGMTDSGVVVGTPEYMSPEQLEGKKVDQRTDLYSLGIILYEMLTGRLPFEGDTPFSIAIKHKTEPTPEPRKLNIRIPTELSRVVMKCLKKERENRYQSAEELLSELSRIEKELPTPNKGLLRKKFKARIPGLRLKKFLIPAGLFLLAIIIVGGYFVLDRILSTKKGEKDVNLAATGQITQETAPAAPLRGILEISSIPEGAEVYLGDKHQGTTPFKQELPPGTYKIRIKKPPLYKDLTDELKVTAGETFTKTYPLSALYGLLDINSTPKGAEVYLNNKREGVTPFKREISPGTYRIRIKKSPQYGDITDELKVTAGQPTSRNYRLASQYGNLEITSAPQGAEVYINNKREGVTPFKRALPPGTYRIRVRKSSEYEEVTDFLRVNSGKTSSKNYPLVPVYILDLRTAPEGANVSIDGIFRGKTPLKVELSKNTCRLKIEKGKEWSLIEESVDLQPGLNNLEYPLAKMKYSLSIKTNPSGARVSLGNEPFGTSPVKKSILSGVYNIKIEKQGYQTVEESIRLESDIERAYEMTRLIPGKIRLKVHPYADVLIDGKLIGEVPPIRIQEIAAGKHTIEFVSTRLNRKFTVEVEIGPGESKEIRMNMETGKSTIVKLSSLE